MDGPGEGPDRPGDGAADGPTAGPVDARAGPVEPARLPALSAQRLHELTRWHGTDEGNLPPAHTLANLSRDTIAALAELIAARRQVAELRAALAEVFWAGNVAAQEIALRALGPPPEAPVSVLQLPDAVEWKPSPIGPGAAPGALESLRRVEQHSPVEADSSKALVAPAPTP